MLMVKDSLRMVFMEIFNEVFIVCAGKSEVLFGFGYEGRVEVLHNGSKANDGGDIVKGRSHHSTKEVENVRRDLPKEKG